MFRGEIILVWAVWRKKVAGFKKALWEDKTRQKRDGFKARNNGNFVFSGIEIKRNKTKMRTCNEAEAGKAPHFGDSAPLCCCENSASLIKRVSKVEFLRTQVDISKEIYCSKRKKFCSSFFSKPIEQWKVFFVAPNGFDQM